MLICFIIVFKNIFYLVENRVLTLDLGVFDVVFKILRIKRAYVLKK